MVSMGGVGRGLFYLTEAAGWEGVGWRNNLDVVFTANLT